MLIRPDSFARDWRGYVVNQFGHAAAGVVMPYVLSIAAVALWGEVPFKWQIALLSIAFYPFVIELAIQGWRAWDTVEDTVFVSYGVAMSLMTFTEVRPGVIEGRIDAAAGVFCIGTLHLMGGAAYRFYRAKIA